MRREKINLCISCACCLYLQERLTFKKQNVQQILLMFIVKQCCADIISGLFRPICCLCCVLSRSGSVQIAHRISPSRCHSSPCLPRGAATHSTTLPPVPICSHSFSQLLTQIISLISASFKYLGEV